MYDSLLPFKTIVGTLLVFMVFILTFFLTVSIRHTTPSLMWFSIPMLVFLALGLLRMITKISKHVQLKEEHHRDGMNKKVVLSTCPEYWVKETVNIDHEPGSIVDHDTPIQKAHICKNYFDYNGTPHYVGGSGNGNVNSKFSMNFKDGDQVKPFDETISALQSQMRVTEGFNSEDDDATGFVPGDDATGFVPGDDATKRGIEPNDDAFAAEATRSATHPREGNGIVQTTYLEPSMITDSVHIHHVGPILTHDFNDPDHSHSHVDGKVPHRHNFFASNLHNGPGNTKTRPFTHGQHWINQSTPDIHPNGVEINLSKLNEAENVCELAKQFHWSEAFEKCT
jgi:hypothetical protein